MDYRGGTVPVAVTAAVTAALTALGRSRGATLFMVLQAAFAALLHRLGGAVDLVIGTAVAGRNRFQLEGLVGFFVNTLALRHRVDGGISFAALLAATRRSGRWLKP
jgi:non-ribosomal peptide synthetase component F